jgi:16S rRNA processing protein RimM
LSAPRDTPPAEASAPLVEVGRVARPHGVRGELRVRLHWPDSESLLYARSVVLRLADGERRHRVERARRADRAVLLKLVGLDTLDAVDALRGAEVLVPRAALGPLEAGEFYLCDLIGARVTAPSGDVGRVEEIVTHPSVDALVIRTPDGRLVEQPLSEPWVAGVDVVAHLVQLASTDGLIG